MSRILIIEDEEAIADLEKDYLELSGFEVEIENRGDTGLVRAMKEDFDLIILDLMLPEVDGFDICRQVREEKNTPIIMVSAKKDDIDKIRGLGLGADAVSYTHLDVYKRQGLCDTCYVYTICGKHAQNPCKRTQNNCKSCERSAEDREESYRSF